MCQPGTHDPDLHTRLREGLRLDLLGERWRAVLALEELLQEHPSFSEVRGHLAWIYYLQGNNLAAIKHLRELVQAEPANTEAAQRIAESEAEATRLSRGEIEQEEAYRLARELGSDTSRGARSSQREALVLFHQLREEGVEDSNRWVSRLSFGLQDFSLCLRATEAGLEEQPEDAELAKRLGSVHEFLGNPSGAIEVYRRALEIDPNSIGIIANLISLGAESSDTLPWDSPLVSLFTDETTNRTPPTKSPRFLSWFKKSQTPQDRAWRLAKDLRRDPGFRDLPCNLCGNNAFEGVAVGRENGWPIMRCAECGLIQTHPQPTQETLTKKYQEQYYGEGAIDTARHIHEASPIGGEPMTMLPRVMDFLIAEGLNDYEDSLPQKRMLDVGCGEGVLLRDFRIRGWECEGTEVSSPAIGFLREKGYGVHEGVLEGLALSEEHYQLITLSHVIEHVRHPLGDLQRIHSLLASGGWLFVTTPGADSLPERIAGEDWYYDPDHIFFFSRSTLGRMIEKAGFDVFGQTSYVGVGRETWEEAWLREGIGPSVKRLIEERNEGDVLLMVGRKI